MWDKMNYKKSRQLMNIGIWGGIAVLVVFYATDIMLFGVLVMILVLGGMLQALVFYKCPSCNVHFNIRGGQPDFCPKCGCDLEKSLLSEDKD